MNNDLNVIEKVLELCLIGAYSYEKHMIHFDMAVIYLLNDKSTQRNGRHS